MVASNGDWEMDGQTSSKNLVAANDGAKRTVSVHVYRWNHATQGQSDDDTRPGVTAVKESRDRDLPVTSLNRNDSNKANDVDGPKFVAFGMPCL